jgi:hypothetical protein
MVGFGRIVYRTAGDEHTAEEMKKCVAPYALKRGFKILKTKVTGKSDYPTEQTN